jgi:hypothetical protein
VTFEVDANGILNVAAEDKGTGKKEKITITAEKGRLSQEEIDRMVKEAEEFADQDKAVKGKIDARNSLETFLYNAKSTVEDKAKDKVRLGGWSGGGVPWWRRGGQSGRLCFGQRAQLAFRLARGCCSACQHQKAGRRAQGAAAGVGAPMQTPTAPRMPGSLTRPPRPRPPLPQISDEDKKKVNDAVKEAQEWLEENSDAEADEYKDRLKEVEDVVSPIFAKVGGGSLIVFGRALPG